MEPKTLTMMREGPTRHGGARDVLAGLVVGVVAPPLARALVVVMGVARMDAVIRFGERNVLGLFKEPLVRAWGLAEEEGETAPPAAPSGPHAGR